MINLKRYYRRGKRLLRIASRGTLVILPKVGIKKTWIGNDYGGFFLNLGLLDSRSIIYSIGVGEDLSFDEEIMERKGCSVFGFDPTPKSISWVREQAVRQNPKFTFLPVGVGAVTERTKFFLPKNKSHISGSAILQSNVDAGDYIDVNLQTISDISASLGHKKIDVVKMDIEGGEYSVIPSLLSSDLEVVQLLVEFHGRLLPKGKEATKEIVDLLESRGFLPFAASDSFEEISFINRKYIDTATN